MTVRSVNRKRSNSYEEWTEMNAQYLLYLMKQTDLSRIAVEENENIHMGELMGASNCASLIRSSSSRKRTKRTRETEATQDVEEYCYERINSFEPGPSVSTISSSSQDNTLTLLGGEWENESFLWQEEMDEPVQTSADDSPTLLCSQINMNCSGNKNNVDFPAQIPLETAFDREDLSFPLESTSEGITMSSKEKQLLLEIVNQV